MWKKNKNAILDCFSVQAGIIQNCSECIVRVFTKSRTLSVPTINWKTEENRLFLKDIEWRAIVTHNIHDAFPKPDTTVNSIEFDTWDSNSFRQELINFFH